MTAPPGRLILVKHAAPVVEPSLPAAHWRLSEAGRERALALAQELAPLTPTRVVASREPKARETGKVVARALGLPLLSADGLHEHDRTNEPFDEDPTRFEESMAAFFARPGERVYGLESADQAHDRFSAAVEGLGADHPGETLAIVAHGTVITLYATRRSGEDPFALWKRLKLGDWLIA